MGVRGLKTEPFQQQLSVGDVSSLWVSSRTAGCPAAESGFEVYSRLQAWGNHHTQGRRGQVHPGPAPQLWWLSGKESTFNAGDTGLILGWEDPLEKEMATHSSILAWEIPWTEEPGGLQSMESKESDTT